MASCPRHPEQIHAEMFLLNPITRNAYWASPLLYPAYSSVEEGCRRLKCQYRVVKFNLATKSQIQNTILTDRIKITSGRSILTKKAGLRPHMDGSIVFTRWRHCAPPSNMLPWTTRVHVPNDISIGSAVFAGLTTVTDRQTDRPTVRPRYSVCNNRPHLCLRSTAMRSNNVVDYVEKSEFLVHGQVTIIFVVSVCLSVCLCRVFLSRL